VTTTYNADATYRDNTQISGSRYTYYAPVNYGKCNIVNWFSRSHYYCNLLRLFIMNFFII